VNLAGQKRAAPGHVVLRVIEYQVDGGEVIRLLTDLLDPGAYPAAELAALYRERWEADTGSGKGRSADPGRRPTRADAAAGVAIPASWKATSCTWTRSCCGACTCCS